MGPGDERERRWDVGEVDESKGFRTTVNVLGSEPSLRIVSLQGVPSNPQNMLDTSWMVRPCVSLPSTLRTRSLTWSCLLSSKVRGGQITCQCLGGRFAKCTDRCNIATHG